MLKVDLLPVRIPRARTNKVLLVFILALLGASVLGVLSLVGAKTATLAARNKEFDEWKVKADAVRTIEGETGTMSGKLKPIADKVSFIEQADECGYPYWERFAEVNEYIYGGAQLHWFGIAAHAVSGLVGDGTPEALFNVTGSQGTDCAFEVTVKNPNEFGRFILNLIRCPEITNVQINGSVTGARAIVERWPQLLEEWGLPNVPIQTPNLQGLNLSGGSSGGGGMGGGMMGGAPGGGMPGGAPGGGMGAPGGMGGGMGAPGGMGGGMGGAMGGGAAAGGSGGAAAQARLDGPIRISVTCQLRRPVMVPSPPSGGGGAAAAAGGMGGGMGAPGGGMGGGMGAPGGGMGAPGGGAGAGAPPSGGAKSSEDSGGDKAAPKGGSAAEE